MKRKYFLLAVLMILVLSVSPVFAATKKSTKTTTTTSTKSSSSGVSDINDGIYRIAMLISGDLGDMSFWDSANEGMLRFANDYKNNKVEVKIIEMGSSDTTVYESTLNKTASEAYDLIIVGTTDMREPLQRVSKNKKFADRKFIIFDTEIKDNAASSYTNVHSIMFNQYEGGYLAGVLATLMSKELNGKNTAFIGGASNDIINDFVVGFAQGVKAGNSYAKTNVKAYTAFIGDFVDSPKGKSLATSYYNNDVEILFAAASQAGIGCIEAAKLTGNLIIGVDSDQYAYYKNSDPAKAAVIVTSVEKKVGDALYEACEKFVNGKLTYGDLEVLGVKDGKIGLSQNENYTKLVPSKIREYLAQVENDIASGKITVKSGLKRYMTSDERYSLLDSVDPTK